jgi:hypothetical protein
VSPFNPLDLLDRFEMSGNMLCAGLLLLLFVCHSGFASSSSNWLTKSLDYFAYEKCSYLEKSDLSGKFYKCLQQPKRNRRAAAAFGDFGSFSDFSKFLPKQPIAGATAGSDPVKTGAEHSGTSSTGGFGSNMIPEFASKFQKQTTNKPSSSFESKYYESSDSKYPIGVCRYVSNADLSQHEQTLTFTFLSESFSEEKKIMKCLSVFTEADCLTEKEHKFFEDLELFFRVRTQFICRKQHEVVKCKRLSYLFDDCNSNACFNKG